MLNLIPQPSSIKELDLENFKLASDASISADEKFQDVANLMASYLRPSTGYELPVVDSNGSIEFVIEENAVIDEQGFTDETYSIKISEAKVVISAKNDHGAVRAIQTIRQLFDPEILSLEVVEGKSWELPAVEIDDSPVLKWRGSHLDVSRHFSNVDQVKKYIDTIALHKLNMLHLHLTDDQGWRIEIKKYPKLTEVGSKRTGTVIGHHHHDKPRRYTDVEHSGFFTQEDIKELVNYAAERRITILPEIDMPGHMQAAISAYPELGNYGFDPGVRRHWHISQHILNIKDSTINVMKDILGEVIDLFPSTYIHIGGDEAPKHEWEESEEAQTKMFEEGLKDEKELQRWFIKQIRDYIDSRGRKLIGWEEILEGGPLKDTAVMNWISVDGAQKSAANKNYVVNTFQQYLYLDYYQGPQEEEPLCIHGLTTTEKVYSYNPVPEGLEDSPYLLGAQVQVWTEYMPSFEQIEYMAFPRLCAFSEIAWSSSKNKDYHAFVDRLDYHRNRLESMNVNSHPKPTNK